jgi:hypothetical protein
MIKCPGNEQTNDHFSRVSHEPRAPLRARHHHRVPAQGFETASTTRAAAAAATLSAALAPSVLFSLAQLSSLLVPVLSSIGAIFSHFQPKSTMFANRLVRSLKVKPSVALARSMGGGGHHGPMMPPFIRIRPPSATVSRFFCSIFRVDISHCLMCCCW